MPEPAPKAATKFGAGAAVVLEVVVAMSVYRVNLWIGCFC